MELAEIKEKFEGVWKLDRSENFQEFLQEVGVGLPLRKMASLAKPEMTITIENDNKIKIIMKTGFFTQEDCFHLNEEFLKEMQGTIMKATATYEEGMIKMTNTPVDPKSKVKEQIIHRERIGDEMVLTLYTGNVVCKRYMKKIG
ncbi:fatty acid-binding protein homolog 6-like [Ostrea edulis]|uniref:fatty acid-binding protein homolog 6-like n=1 Tax=Ostrea edulis TaxID=37623 RepID=UPI0024AEB2CC|nr:fatty acid-binding protein homolog 6-like [Ostrea edulis]